MSCASLQSKVVPNSESMMTDAILINGKRLEWIGMGKGQTVWRSRDKQHITHDSHYTRSHICTDDDVVCKFGFARNQSYRFLNIHYVVLNFTFVFAVS